MSSSFNISLLIDNSAGAFKISDYNWTGAVYKISRSRIRNYKDKTELQTSGIYFLLGTALNSESNKKFIYVGQAGARNNGDGVYRRMIEKHSFEENNEDDYWSEAIIITRPGERQLGATELNYLENLFYRKAKDANVYLVKNSVEPTRGNVASEMQNDMEEFAKHAELILKIIGYDMFTQSQPENDNCEVMVDTYVHMWPDGQAQMRQVDDDIILLRGSDIAPDVQDSAPNSAKVKRKENADAIDENGKLTRDVVFNSPSQALAFVRGLSISGPRYWRRVIDDRTLAEVNSEL